MSLMSELLIGIRAIVKDRPPSSSESPGCRKITELDKKGYRVLAISAIGAVIIVFWASISDEAQLLKANGWINDDAMINNIHNGMLMIFWGGFLLFFIAAVARELYRRWFKRQRPASLHQSIREGMGSEDIDRSDI
jgi:p-aminobenzoyl-glutamate transporter AbgT